MRIARMLRWAALAAVMTAVLPSPGSAQLGRLIKKKLREAIAEATVTSNAAGTTAAKADSEQSLAAALAPALATIEAGRAAAAAGPVFDDNLLEISGAVLARLEQAISAQYAHQEATGKRNTLDALDAALTARRLTKEQYALLKERLYPFCFDLNAARPAGESFRIPDGSVFYVYSKAEVAALRASCARLAPMLRSGV